MWSSIWNRRWVLLICALLLGAIVSLCFVDFGGKSAHATDTAEKVHISFAAYGNARQKQIIKECARVFEREHNCIVDSYCFSKYSELEERVISQYSVGEPFDVFISDAKMMYLLADGGWLRPLDDIVESSAKAGDAFVPLALNYGRYMGRQYALPTGLRPYMLIFNEELIQKSGMESPVSLFGKKQWTFADFTDYLRAYTERTGKPALAVDASWPVLFSLANEGEGFLSVSDNASIALDETCKKRLVDYQNLIKEGVVLHVAQDEHKAELSDIFRAESVPLIIGGIEYINKLYDADWLDWDIVPLPSKDSGFSNSPIDVQLISVSGGGANTKLAAEFAQYYVSTFGQKLRLEMGEYQISSLDMTFYTSMGDVKFPEHSNYYMLALTSGYGEPTMKVYVNNRQAVLTWFDDLLAGRIEPQENIYIQK